MSESRRKRPSALSSEDLGDNGLERDGLRSKEPARPKLGANPVVLCKILSAFFEKNDLILEGKREFRDFFFTSGEGGVGSTVGRVGYGGFEGDTRGLEILSATFESDKKFCSRIRERCT
jgi:hypothetical protein